MAAQDDRRRFPPTYGYLDEKVFSFHHEDWTRRIILDEATEVNRILRGFGADLPEKLNALFLHNYSPAFVSQLVSSQLDCDRMDYLLRDSLMTGAKYGMYDLEWVLHALRIDESSDRIYVESKGLYAVEEYLQARYYMFRQVYFHRTLRSAEAVLNSALGRARLLMSSGKLRLSAARFGIREDAVGREGKHRRVSSARRYRRDVSIERMVARRRHDSRGPVEPAAGSKTFKAIDVAPIFPKTSGQTPPGSLNAPYDPQYYLVTDRASDVPYYSDYSPVGMDPERLIYVEAGLPLAIREISEVSDVVRGMHGYRIDRVCVPSEVADEVSRLANEHSRDSQSSSAGN